MSSILLEMAWLPLPDEDFRTTLRPFRTAETLDKPGLRRLATSRLDINQLHSLARVIGRHRASQPEKFQKLSVLSNATTDLLIPALVGTAARHDICLDATGTTYGSFVQEALDKQSATNRRDDDFVLLALDYRAFNLIPTPGDEATARTAVDAAVALIGQLADALRAASGATVIVQTVPPPPDLLFGSLDALTPGTLRWIVDRINAGLRANPGGGTLMFDVAMLAERIGLDLWHDPVQWNLGKFPFSQKVVPIYSEWLSRLIASAQGKSRKCLVLDLDNTLWGGVIGDDGLHGVVLGQGHPVGEAHLAVQATALALRARGIILAVSSKNDETIARSMFREHPEMLLREEHIAVFQANWNDKATNLRAIAETLNIGIDSLVFLDDNPAERRQVRLALPEVAVPELPDAPDHFATTLLAAGYFETTQFTEDDRRRADQYSANASRRAALGTGTDLAAYLESLSMEADVAPFDPVGRARITQLINKTNQFNLTTRRYTEAQVATFEADPATITLQIRLKDSFGDNGMISVVICRDAGAELDIDTWLMSCRVLNRRVEEAVLNLLVLVGRALSKQRLRGEFIATDRNGLVRDHYERLGFAPLSNTAEHSLWVLDLGSYVPRDVPIRLKLDPRLASIVAGAGA